jgi:asparagine synthase (glutamine-hydrolysing)
MCGIAGLIEFAGPASRGLLAAMNDRLSHRGPDDHGEWVEGHVGLANRRLAILDLSAAGHQPMQTADGRFCVAYNGEIYNYVELRSELAASGHRFITSTDTEVLLASYAEWGERCVERFNGMFAFAIWDAPNRRLFAARDRFGEKPFYYHHSAKRFVFASEIKALLVDTQVPRRADEESVARYLLLAHVDGDERTFFEGIRQLAPAHSLTVDAEGRVCRRRYWDLDLDCEPGPTDSTANAERFRELLSDAVRLRLRSDVPVGSSLSGGLDSSSLVCLMDGMLRRDSGAVQKTFSARYRSGGTDEGVFIQSVVANTNVEAHNIWIEGEDLNGDLERFVYHQDEPVAHTNQFAQWKVMELARDTNVTVLLDGQGADEVLGGYPSPTFGYRYAELLRSGDVMALFRELSAFRRHHGSLAPAFRYMGAALLPPALRSRIRARVHRRSNLSARVGRASAANSTRHAPLLRRALYETLTVTSLPSLLRYGDRNSMAFSREARLPFLDHRLVEFVYSLPSDQLVRDGSTKVLLRRAMSGVIPDLVRDRHDKVGFATPERDWFLGPLRPRIERELADLARRDMLAPHLITDQWRAFVSGHAPSGNVWRLVNLNLWLQKFVTA